MAVDASKFGGCPRWFAHLCNFVYIFFPFFCNLRLSLTYKRIFFLDDWTHLLDCGCMNQTRINLKLHEPHYQTSDGWQWWVRKDGRVCDAPTDEKTDLLFDSLAQMEDLLEKPKSLNQVDA